MPSRAFRPYAPRSERAEIVIVCGAPASGKTTYVREHMDDGDLIWDLDAIMHAITGRPLHADRPDGALDFVLGMRERFCAIAAHSKVSVRRVWIIVSERCSLTRDLQAQGATIVDVDTPVDVCRERLKARGPGALVALNEYLKRNCP